LSELKVTLAGGFAVRSFEMEERLCRALAVARFRFARGRRTAREQNAGRKPRQIPDREVQTKGHEGECRRSTS
jgi:hypothetical protein